MELYNTLTQKKEEFVPHTPGQVKMYTCGPTVYHYAHIGNLRSYIMEDVLEKYLRYAGYQVDRVMNITDVGHLSSDADTGEDKMLAGARREHKTVLEIAKFYTDAFFADCQKLRIRKPDTVVPPPPASRTSSTWYRCCWKRAMPTRLGATCTSIPPSWRTTTSLATRAARTWPWASGTAWRRTRTSGTKPTLCCGLPSPSLRTRS